MTSRDMMDTRIWLMEDAMYRRSDDLERHLHELESRLEALSAAIHRDLCEDGQTPLEMKTCRIVRAVEDFEAGIDLTGIRAKGERVRSLKGLIDSLEREISERFGVVDERSEIRRRVDELASIA